MKFKVELTNFYLEEEDIESGLKSAITHEVIDKINRQITEKVDKQITEKVTERMLGGLDGFITKRIDDLLGNETIIYNGKTVLIVDHIKYLFDKHSGWNSPTEQIKTLADKFGKELKGRYDLQFASHVVAKLNDQGMLKDDVARMLLPEAGK